MRLKQNNVSDVISILNKEINIQLHIQYFKFGILKWRDKRERIATEVYAKAYYFELNNLIYLIYLGGTHTATRRLLCKCPQKTKTFEIPIEGSGPTYEPETSLASALAI